MQNKTSLQIKSLRINLDRLSEIINTSEEGLSKIIKLIGSGGEDQLSKLAKKNFEYKDLKDQIINLKSKLDTEDINKVTKNYEEIHAKFKKISGSIIDEVKELNSDPTIESIDSKQRLQDTARQMALNLKALLHSLQPLPLLSPHIPYIIKYEEEQLRSANLPVPLKVVTTEAVTIEVPTSSLISTPKASDKTDPSQKDWAKIRLERIGSKWKKEGWQDKKISVDKIGTEVDLNKATIQACADKIESLMNSSNNSNTEDRQAKINIYVKQGWSSEQDPEKNILTVSQNGEPIFEVRPGENKIQFLISNPNELQRVAAFEMFQQMCRAKGIQQKVKINCDDKDMKNNFQDEAKIANITTVDSFSNRLSPKQTRAKL